MSIRDQRKRSSPVAIRVNQADAEAWLDAADAAARAATQLGVFFDAVAALSNGTIDERGVTKYEVDTTVGYPAVQDPPIFIMDKYAFNYESVGTVRQQIFTIPCRGNAVPASDGVTLDLADGGVVQDFVTAFEAVVVGIAGGATTVLSGRTAD